MQCSATIECLEAEAGQPPKRPRFSINAYHGGALRVFGFYRPVVVDLAGLKSNKRVPILLDHDPTQIVGQADDVSIEARQVTLAGVVTGDDDAAGKVVGHARNGFVWGASVGVGINRLESVNEKTSVTVNGQSFKGPIYVVRAGTLREVSFVAIGADEKASARVAAGYAAEVFEMDFNEWLKAKGFDADALTDDQRASLQAMYDAEQAKDDDAPPENPPTPAPAPKPKVEASGSDDDETSVTDDIRAEVVAEKKRIQEIQAACKGHPDIEVKAIEEGWTRDRAELEVLRAGRPKAPAIHAAENVTNGLVLEAACLLTAKHAEAEKQFDEKTLETASRRFRGGIGLQELLLEAAWANGYAGRNFRDHRAVLRAAFGRDVQAGFSTIDISGILSNVTNKFLLEGFFSVERTWRNICAVRNVSDFKTVTSYRLIGKDQYEEVAPGGELKHGTLGEESYSNKADTFGLMLSIDRRDMINDDLGAITTVPRKLGRGSGLKINDEFWRIFLANSAFFTTGNKNYLVGADTVLGIDGLTKAEVAFMNLVDADGKPTGIMPAIVLVPPALSATGTMLFKSLEIRDTTASTKYPVANPHQGKFRTEVSRYLSNSHYTGYSEKAWYLLADPNDVAVIEVAFLNGQESPTIETADADFNVLGIQMRGYHDFGVALQETRAGVKAKGEN